MHIEDVWFVILALVLAWLWFHLSWTHHLKSAISDPHQPPQRSPQPLIPRAQDDCPLCRTFLAHTHVPQLRPAAPPPPPWSTVKKPRGRTKSSATNGFACRQPTCAYRLITEARHHALVADGTHGRDRIPDFRCQACGHKFSARRDTALYRLRTSHERVSLTLSLIAEGCDLTALQRVFHIQEATLRLWLTRAGLHAQRLHAHFGHALPFTHVQLDELYTTTRQSEQGRWLWVALDALTKFIPALVLGPRTQDRAHQLIHQLRWVLDTSHLPVFSSDGLKLYFYALTAHFGQWVPPDHQAKRTWRPHPDLLYAQVNKIHRRRRLLRVERHLLCGTLETFTSRLQALGLSGRIQTAFIERVNLTLRRSLAPLARRSWSQAQLPGELTFQIEWWRAYYHFVRPHQALRLTLDAPRPSRGLRTPQRYQARTPAMASGLTSHPWSVQEVLTFPLPQ
jgi:IS1 family transposase